MIGGGSPSRGTTNRKTCGRSSGSDWVPHARALSANHRDGAVGRAAPPGGTSPRAGPVVLGAGSHLRAGSGALRGEGQGPPDGGGVGPLGGATRLDRNW